MAKEFINEMNRRKAAQVNTQASAPTEMQLPQNALYATEQSVMQYPQLPMNGVDSDVADPLNGNRIDPLGDPLNFMYMAGMPSTKQTISQSQFKSDNQFNQQSTLAERQIAMARQDDLDEYKKFWERDLNAWGTDIATRTKLPDDAWGNDILTRDLRKVDPLGNRGNF